MGINIVKLQSRKVGNKGIQYIVTVPKELVNELKWVKGDKLIVRTMDIKINGIMRKVLVYYKP